MLTGLTEELNRKIDDLLLELLVRSEAEAVFLCNRGGYILAETTTQTYEHCDNIAALAAGAFFATMEIARLIGEPEFRSVLHHGERKGLYMQITGVELLVLVVFGRQSNAGLVKLCTEESCREFEAQFKAHGHSGQVESMLQDIEIEIREGAKFFRPMAPAAVD